MTAPPHPQQNHGLEAYSAVANAMKLAGSGRADVAVVGTLAAAILGSHAAADREIGWYTVVLGIGSMLMVR